MSYFAYFKTTECFDLTQLSVLRVYRGQRYFFTEDYRPLALESFSKLFVSSYTLEGILSQKSGTPPEYRLKGYDHEGFPFENQIATNTAQALINNHPKQPLTWYEVDVKWGSFDLTLRYYVNAEGTLLDALAMLRLEGSSHLADFRSKLKQEPLFLSLPELDLAFDEQNRWRRVNGLAVV